MRGRWTVRASAGAEPRLGKGPALRADRARLYLVVLALQEELLGVRVHCDLAPAQNLWRQRDDYDGLLGNRAQAESDQPLADLVSPLVITGAGLLKPICLRFRFAVRHHVAGRSLV
jgi:hypothetical protein